MNFINDEILPDDDDGYSVSVSDVERCHPLGRPNRTGNRQIIVKFRNYLAKSKVYAAKSKLKGHPDKTFMSEDLTQYSEKSTPVPQKQEHR